MSDDKTSWFHRNATPAIVTYSILLAGSVWAISTFILQDDKLNLLRSQLETQRSLTEQYKAKTELLQRDIELVRAENTEYKNWLAQVKDAVPLIVPKMVELQAKVKALEGQAVKLRAENPTQKIFQEYRTSLGRAFIDEGTGTIVTLRGTTVDRRASVIVKFPGKDPIEETVPPGKQWAFQYSGKSYTLTVMDVNWATDTVGFRITPTN